MLNYTFNKLCLFLQYRVLTSHAKVQATDHVCYMKIHNLLKSA